VERRLPFSFEDIDFGSGKLLFYMNCCDEDTPLLAQIKYPNGFDLIIEHIDGRGLLASIYWEI
jgi:hypothetical protein